jgi:hypothetical protein
LMRSTGWSNTVEMNAHLSYSFNLCPLTCIYPCSSASLTNFFSKSSFGNRNTTFILERAELSTSELKIEIFYITLWVLILKLFSFRPHESLSSILLQTRWQIHILVKSIWIIQNIVQCWWLCNTSFSHF